MLTDTYLVVQESLFSKQSTKAIECKQKIYIKEQSYSRLHVEGVSQSLVSEIPL